MLTEREKKLQIATFRFGIISEFVTGVRLEYGEKERLIREKIARTYDVPFSKTRTRYIVELPRQDFGKYLNSLGE